VKESFHASLRSGTSLEVSSTKSSLERVSMINFSTFFIAWRSGSKCGTLRAKQTWKQSDGGRQFNHERLSYWADMLNLIGSYTAASSSFYQSGAYLSRRS